MLRDDNSPVTPEAASEVVSNKSSLRRGAVLGRKNTNANANTRLAFRAETQETVAPRDTGKRLRIENIRALIARTARDYGLFQSRLEMTPKGKADSLTGQKRHTLRSISQRLGSLLAGLRIEAAQAELQDMPVARPTRMSFEALGSDDE